MELNLHDIVRIKKTGEKGFVVDISFDEDDGAVSQYLIEKDTAAPDGAHEKEWFYPEEISLSTFNKKY